MHRTGGGTFTHQVTDLETKATALLGYRATTLYNTYDAYASYNNESGLFSNSIETVSFFFGRPTARFFAGGG